MPSTTLTSVLSGAGSIGLFASRAFVSAFAVAALLKWGPQIDVIHNTGLLQQIKDVPSWFTHDVTVTILGLLALLEIAATKSPDARQLLLEVENYIKTGTGFLTTLTVSGIISQNDADVIREITTWNGPLQAGFGDHVVAFLTASIAAVGIWFACSARKAVLGTLMEADPGDDTMIGGAISWLEDLWALMGTLLLILFPFVMLGITALLLVLIWLLQQRAKRKEEQSKQPCASCGVPMYQSAVNCPSCRAANTNIKAIGWLGQTLDTPTANREHHPITLMQKQRCPVCATYLKPRQARQACEVCGHDLFKDPPAIEAYLQTLNRRVPTVLIITALLSLIPIVGLIPAIMVYRIKLVAPLRRYTSMMRTIPMRWGLRILFLILVWVQVLPGIGAAAVPVMALISYGSYRGMFRRQFERESQKLTAQSA